MPDTDVMCELERVLVNESDRLRGALQTTNPVTDLRYELLFRRLIGVDHDLRLLRGEGLNRAT